MATVKIEGSPKTPNIILDSEKGLVEISGRSIPENAVEIFKPVLEWLEEYSQKPQVETCVNLKLEYFNTSSSKSILSILKRIEGLGRDEKSKVSVNWFYEQDDEDMLEAGEDFDAIIKVPFKMVSVEEF